jgi:ubiquinone/menaquinone biosynthesis C-methylase UbiE
MVKIHRAAAEGFTAGVANYVSGRPEYPEEIEKWLIHDLALSSGKTVVDLGAGTGKFSPRLLATGAKVIAVEPLSSMSDELGGRYPEVEVKQGFAEDLPLESASVDAIVCAQSFHWFATQEALHEIRRVLKPAGTLGLVWNVRDDRVEWVAALSGVMEPYEGDTPRFHSQEWRKLFPAEGFGPLRETEFSNQQTGSPEQVIIERVLSVSFIAALASKEREDVIARLRQLISASPQLSGKAEVCFPYRTYAFSCCRWSDQVAQQTQKH